MAVIHKSDNPESLLDLWNEESDDIFKSKRASDKKSAFGDFVSGDTRCLAVEYNYIQYYKPNNPSIGLLAIYFRHDDKIYFTADSAALISKGMVCMLADVFSNSTKSDIASFEEKELSGLNLDNLLTPGRRNGVYSMLKVIQGYGSRKD